MIVRGLTLTTHFCCVARFMTKLTMVGVFILVAILPPIVLSRLTADFGIAVLAPISLGRVVLGLLVESVGGMRSGQCQL